MFAHVLSTLAQVKNDNIQSFFKKIHATNEKI